MDPVTFALLGVVLGGVGLKWLESTFTKNEPVAIEANVDEDERDKALACPFYLSRDYEDRAIAAGIMSEQDRNLCDDCDYCNSVRDKREQDRWNKLHAQQEADRVLASRRRKETEAAIEEKQRQRRIHKHSHRLIDLSCDYTYYESTGITKFTRDTGPR